MYSHYGYDDPFLGHGPRGHWPDQPWRNNNIDFAKTMARQTYEELKKYAKELKCCAARPSDKSGNLQWDKVDKFLEFRYGGFFKGINDTIIDRKREILTDHKDHKGNPAPRRGAP